MKITFTKRNGRTHLVCARKNGTTAFANLGPYVPFHDLAHFVVEKKIGLHNGFFGHVFQGYSIDELSQKEVILSLDPEIWQSEILSRALGSLATGACTQEEFADLVNSELSQFGWPTVSNLNDRILEDMLQTYRDLMAAYNQLEEGESLQLEFSI